MKRIIKRLFFIFLTLSLFSCVKEGDPQESGGESVDQNGRMEITLLPSEDAEEGTLEAIRSARFIVFDNATGSDPTIDVNRLFFVTDMDNTAPGFTLTLEVSLNPDKMVVVIVNEPAALSSPLGQVFNVETLRNIRFKMADLLNAGEDHTLVSTGMPMTGVQWVGEKHGSAIVKDEVTELKITIERALACVEVYLKAEAGVLAQVPVGAEITLSNTYTHGYLPVGTEADGTRYQTEGNSWRNFGRMQRVTSGLHAVSWEASKAKPVGLDETFVCRFYTPERTCDAAGDVDKLKVKVSGITRQGITLIDKEAVLDEALNVKTGIKESLSIVKRNNMYRIIGKISYVEEEEPIEFDTQIQPWVSIDIPLPWETPNM